MIHFSVGIAWTSPENYSWVLCGIHAFSADRNHQRVAARLLLSSPQDEGQRTHAVDALIDLSNFVLYIFNWKSIFNRKSTQTR